QNNGINPAHRIAIDQHTEQERTGGESPAEIPFELAILCLAEMEVLRDADRCIGQRLAVHVVDCGSQKEQPADPPLPRRRSGGRRFAQAFHDLPSQRMTRSSNATTSSVNTRNNASPFSAVAAR